MDSFGILAEKYDLYNAADYDGYASFVRGLFAEAGIAVTEVLDLGCGTGELSLRLADRGYSVTAVDCSDEMLSVLAGKVGDRDIRVICQDMRELELYGTVQACVSSFDCLNYLTSASDLELALGRVGLFMEKNGVFVFDVNTDYAYHKLFADNSFVCEADGSMLVWRNDYNEKSRLHRFYLTSFELQPDGVYMRDDAVHVQKNHSMRTIKSAAAKAGFDIAAVYGSPSRDKPCDTDRKAYFVLVKNRQL